MKDKTTAADKHNPPLKKDLDMQTQVRCGQAVDTNKVKKIKELCKKKVKNNHMLEEVDKADQKTKQTTANKSGGSHSLSELHFFQTYHSQQ